MKHSVFSKMILFFSCVLVLSFAVILVYSSQYLNEKALSTLENDSIRALNAASNYVNEKYLSAQRMIASLYKTKYYQIIPSYMGAPSANIETRQNFASTLDEFLQYHFSSDLDISNIALEIYEDQSVYLLLKEADKDRKIEAELRAMIDKYRESMKPYGATILPAYTSAVSPYRGTTLPMLCPVKQMNMLSDLGCILVVFSTQDMESELPAAFRSSSGSVLYMVDREGTVLYDSSGTKTGTLYADFEELQTLESRYKETESGTYYIGVEYDSELEVYFVSAQDVGSIYASLQPQKNVIYLGILLLSAVSICSIFLFSRKYSRRIAAICSAIRKIQSGNLEVRIPCSSQNDELTLISGNLNDMCSMLQDYIQRVYVKQIEAQSNELLRKDAELRQKAAELYALQTQINPHFLYNTLEAIRMRALSEGNRDVAQMTYLLSTLFRQTLKTGFVCGIPEELDTCRLYLELSTYRYQDRIATSIEVEDELEDCGVIRHILQPLVENSMRHGLRPESKNNRIAIRIFRKENDVILTVTDNGRGMDPERLAALRAQLGVPHTQAQRIGLSNVHQRIAGIFGEDYGVRIDSSPESGTSVSVRIPCMTVKEMKEYVQRFDR